MMARRAVCSHCGQGFARRYVPHHGCAAQDALPAPVTPFPMKAWRSAAGTAASARARTQARKTVALRYRLAV